MDLKAMSSQALKRALDDAYSKGGSWKEAAKLLGVSTRNIYYIRKRLRSENAE